MRCIYTGLASFCYFFICGFSDTIFNVNDMYLLNELFECGQCQGNVSTTPGSTWVTSTHSTQTTAASSTTRRMISTTTPAGLVDGKCLRCMCHVESLCKPIDCHMDVGSLSCGYYQMKWPYYIDCGQPGGQGKENWKLCANNKACSEECIHNYMARYAWLCADGGAVTCETFARVHNGGPTGCKKASTDTYWALVNNCYT